MGEPVDTKGVRRIHDPPPLTAQEISAMQECMAMHGLPDGELAERMLATIVSLQSALTAAQQRIADLEAQCARVQRGADRYQFLRDSPERVDMISREAFAAYMSGADKTGFECFDDAIDAAMAEKEAGEDGA